MKKISIGVSDFKELIENDYYYIDKTKFIKEAYESGIKVSLITRPRRFGKTLNLSTLRYFFEKTPEDNSHIFTNTHIWQEKEFCAKNLGKYPVIFLTFKDIKETSWELCYDRIIRLIIKEYARHFSALKSSLDSYEQKEYESIMQNTANQATISDSLYSLSQLLYKHYKNKVIVLIDEYDTPIHTAYLNGFYDDMASFLRNLLPPLLKDNIYLNRGFLTGILTVAKAGIFSGLNNLDIITIIDKKFQNKFGFTEPEVMQFLKDYNLEQKKNEVDDWYNGYTFGNAIIYNPWSILKFVEKDGLFQLYWVNTADNKLIKKLIENSLQKVKIDLETLLSGLLIVKKIDETIAFPALENKVDSIWSLFLFTGYLTSVKSEYIEGILNCSLAIPNKEVSKLYQTFIQEIFEQSFDTANPTALFKAIASGDSEYTQKYLQEFIINSMSFYDIKSTESENSYHLFILGLLAFMSSDYEIKSNRESGFGRYDIALIPKNKQKSGIVLELKKAKTIQDLKPAAQNALSQIQNKSYDQEIRSRGIKDIIYFGIAFRAKRVVVLSLKA